MHLRTDALPRCRDERGVALLVVIIAMTAMMTMAGGLLVLTMTETRIAASYGNGVEAFYAAEGAIEAVLSQLHAEGDLDAVLRGRVRSTFTSGLPDGRRTLSDGTTLDMGEVVNMARCGRAVACRNAEMDAYSEERPAGPNNPRWELYADGLVGDLLPGNRLDSRAYIVVLVGDDPFETDDDPLRDGDAGSPGGGALLLRAHAYGPLGVHRVVEAIVSRAGHGMRIISWQELR